MRAIAVVFVVLFHLDIDAFAGGYIGVDVFFVISGFLITSIILGRIDGPGFSFPDFYLRRIRRLVPPLIATVAATAVAGSLILLPADLAAFARSSVAALASVSNIVFFAEAGYWDTSGDLKPLLHTWSLGVEEQFYLFWPAAVVGLAKLRRHLSLPASLGLVTIVGFAVALLVFQRSPSATFYLFPFRIFQFSAGALVAWIPVERFVGGGARRRDLVLTGGLVLVLGSTLVYGSETPFPGWFALPPTLGTVLMLSAGAPSGARPERVDSLGRRLLGNPTAVWLGRVSYSMYLVHWPVISLYRYRFGVELNAGDQLLLAGLTLVATVGMHYGVERRFYQRDSTARSRSVPLAPQRFALRTGAVSVAMALVLAHAWNTDGWLWRFDEVALTPTAVEEGMRARFQLVSRSCAVDRADAPSCDWSRPTQVLVLGNSHEPDGYNLLHAGYGDDPTVNLITFGSTNGCAGIRLEDDRWLADDESCQRRLDLLFRLPVAVDVVVYAANQPYSANKELLKTLVADVLATNDDASLVTLGGYINTTVPCSRLIVEHRTSRACADAEHVRYFEDEPGRYPLYDDWMAMSDTVIDRVGLLCPERRLDRCRTETDDGVPMFYDEHHWSFEFATEAGRTYADAHPDLLVNPAGLGGSRGRGQSG